MLCVSHVAVRASRYLTNSSFGRVGGVRTRSSHSTSRTRAGPVWIKLLVRGRATGEQELKPRFVGEATIHLKQGLQRGIQLPFALLVCGWSTTGGLSLPISKPGRFRQCVFWSDSKGSNQKVGGSQSKGRWISYAQVTGRGSEKVSHKTRLQCDAKSGI